MDSLSAPRGLIVDLVTPLLADGSIDGRGLGRLLDRVIPHCRSILLAGPRAGEGHHLKPAQRSELLNKAMVVVGGRVPLWVWVTQDTTAATVDSVQILQMRVKDRNYAGRIFWVDTPLYHHSNRGLPAHFRELSSVLAHPLLLYNDPTLVGSLGKPLKRSNIRTAVLKGLSGFDALAGLIFLGSLERFHNYEKACRSREGFRIYDGDEGTFLDHPSAAGVLSAGANLAPRAWDQITRAALHLDTGPEEYPDHQQVWKWGNFLHQLKETYASHAAGVIKKVLWDMGILETPTCCSAPPDPEVAARQSAALLRRYSEFL